jgi:hypothetical protein
MTVVKNRGPLQANPGPVRAPSEDTWAAHFPGLWEMLTLPAMPDGRAREGSTLLLFYGDSMVKICLNDRDNALTAWASGVSVQEALEAMERGLQADTLEWRAQKPMTRRKGSK